MNVCIHQPNFFPRIKTLQKIAFSDVWIVLDDVQFEQREYQNRTLISSNHSAHDYWVTLPVSLPNGQKTLIKDVLLADFSVKKRIIRNIRYSFNRSEHLEELLNNLESSINDNDSLTDVCIKITKAMLDPFVKMPKIIKSSSLETTCTGKSERLIELCKKIGGETYIADSGGANYINEQAFIRSNINIIWQVWKYKNIRSICDFDIIKQRNFSGINIFSRSLSEYIAFISTITLSKNRVFCEGKNESIDF